MRPDEPKLTPGQPRGHVQAPDRSANMQQDAAANVVRTQIDSLYDTPGGAPAAATDAQAQSHNPYLKNHSNTRSVEPEQWSKYHSAWQDYYRKYYERYYVGAVQQVHSSYSERHQELSKELDDMKMLTTATGAEPSSSDITKDEAMFDLRNELVEKVQKSSKKVRQSRHFVPIISAIAVLLLFGFLQFNSVIIGSVKAYVTPGEIDPQNIVVDPNASLQVGAEPRLIIPKINVNVPVNYDTKPDQASQLKAMENGVAYFGIPGANSKPGQVGNTVISGHSSNDFIDGGQYKFVFALLERLKEGDIFYLHYEGTRYTYSITRTQVVRPTDVKALVYPTTKPEVTLITCTPLGTALNRLLVTAEQVSPSPTEAAAAPDQSSSDKQAAMPGTAPTVFERIFGQ